MKFINPDADGTALPADSITAVPAMARAIYRSHSVNSLDGVDPAAPRFDGERFARSS
jgi:hypothetical protein